MSSLAEMLTDALNGVNNAAASTVSGPVDLISYGLRKAGLGNVIGDAPVGGSNWMQQKGLTRPTNGLAGDIGEFAGNVLPIAAAAKAPQIANGLLKMGENALAPSTLGSQRLERNGQSLADQLRDKLLPRSVTNDEALAMVSGKTEKPGGTDPARLLGVGIGNGRSYTLQQVPLSYVRANEAGALYDGTVDPARAAMYAKRPTTDVPPVILLPSRREPGVLNVQDGGHRVTAARMRGDETINALVANPRSQR